MGFKRLGFVASPRGKQLLAASKAIVSEFKENLDTEVADTIKSLAKSDNIRLTNFWFERLLVMKNAAFGASPTLRRHFLILLSDFLHQTNYIDASPVEVDYFTDPTVNLEEVVELILYTRLPKYTAQDLGGDYATIDSLAAYFPEVIRRLGLIQNERFNVAVRFRKWIGHLAFKLLRGESLAQHERTAFVMYSDTREGTPGYYPDLPETAIVPVEQSDPLVMEAGELYKAVTLSGPFTNHQKMISDQIFERLTYYFGPHVPELKLCQGYEKPYGPFSVLELAPTETIPWSLEDQLTGITSVTSNFTGSRPTGGSFSIRVPIGVFRNDNVPRAVYPDDPSFRLVLTDQKAAHNFEYEYQSAWRQRWINSTVNDDVLQLALTDAAIKAKTLGACQVEKPTLEGFGLSYLTDEANAKLLHHEGSHIEQKFLLPGSSGGVEIQTLDMTGLKVRFGSVEAIPFGSEFVRLPLKAFREPAPQVVDYVSSVAGLTNDERKRFEEVITLYHNVARFERLTGQKAPLDPLELSKALLRV